MNEAARAKLLLATAIGIFGVLMFLGAMLRREWVKKELQDRGCTPLHIWWFPIAYWSPWGGAFGPAFKVIYLDEFEQKHQAHCWTSNVRSRHIEWVKDKII